MTIQSNPNSSLFRSICEPDELATASTSSSTSSKALRNSPEDWGLNAIAAAPADFRPSSVSSVTAAVVSPKRWSSFGSASFFRPKRTSLSPNGPSHLARHLGEPTQTLLERGMVGEEREAISAARHDAERLDATETPQVVERDALVTGRELLERAHQQLGAARQQGGSSVGRELAITSQSEGEQRPDRPDGNADPPAHHPDV